MRRSGLFALGIAFASGCYSPAAEQNCQLTCATEDNCPIGYACIAGRCTTATVGCAGDGGTDAEDPLEVLPPGCAGVQAGFVGQRCFPPSNPISVGGDFDTTNDARCLATEPKACFVVGDSIIIDQSLTVTGNRALVLWSASTIVVQGVIDVASNRGANKRGAGSNPMACVPHDTSVASNYGPGGGGGSFVNPGGGRGGSARTPIDSEVVAAAVQPSAPPALRGGCDGGDGIESLGSAGAGGGVVYLMANSSITITGTITASGGAGGRGGVSGTSPIRYGGGGGGGSGGLIALDAPALVMTGAHLVAIGGNGGSGAGNNGNDVFGQSGEDSSANPFAQNNGGEQTIPTNGGGLGGVGLGGAAGGSAGAGNIGGGGGAGGGPGHIVFFGQQKTISGGQIVPPLAGP